MSLTTQQKAALKAAILADPVLNAFTNNSDGNDAIARLLNEPASPPFIVWRTDAQVSDIFDAVTWDRYTPVDAADTSALFTNRALLIQTKQMNLQNMLIGREFINAARPNIRAGLRDAVIAIPSGANGAGVSAGGAGGSTVLNACTRNATRAEQIFANASAGSDTTGPVTARVMGREGPVNYDEVGDARNS